MDSAGLYLSIFVIVYLALVYAHDAREAAAVERAKKRNQELRRSFNAGLLVGIEQEKIALRRERAAINERWRAVEKTRADFEAENLKIFPSARAYIDALNWGETGVNRYICHTQLESAYTKRGVRVRIIGDGL